MTRLQYLRRYCRRNFFEGEPTWLNRSKITFAARRQRGKVPDQESTV